MVQIGRSKSQMNALDGLNPTQVSAWRSHACSLSNHMRESEVQGSTQV